jgi:hypothetical protein
MRTNAMAGGAPPRDAIVEHQQHHALTANGNVAPSCAAKDAVEQG